MKTLQDWWDFIDTDSMALKILYFLRNEHAIRSYIKDGESYVSIGKLLQFIGTKSNLICHRNYDYPPCGVYSIRELDNSEEKFEFQFRVDPDKYGPRILLCGALAESKETGNFINILR